MTAITSAVVTVLVLVSSVSSSAPPSSTKTTLANMVDHLEGQLISTAATMVRAFTTSTCTVAVDTACANNDNASSQSSAASVQWKPIRKWSAVVPTDVERCAVSGLTHPWQANLNSSEYPGSVQRQYYAGESNNLAVYPPLEHEWNCSQTYLPTLQPYYAVAAPGNKDLIIVVDVSAANPNETYTAAAVRVEMAKAAAVQLVQTLQSWDFVGVVVYCEFAVKVTPLLVQATPTNIANIVASINKITVRAEGSGAFLANALRVAVDLQATSAGLGYTSGCGAVIAVLSAGGDDQPRDDPVAVTRANPSAVVFAVQLTSSTTEMPAAISATLRRVVCIGSGVAVMAAGPALGTTPIVAAQAAVLKAYFASTPPQPAVRWSSPHAGAFDGINVTTATRPVYAEGVGYVGVVALDVSTSALTLNNTVPLVEVEKELGSRAPRSECASQDNTTLHVTRGDQCEHLDLSSPPPTEASLWGLAALALFFGVVVTVVAFIPLVCEVASCFVCCRPAVYPVVDEELTCCDVVRSGLVMVTPLVFWLICVTVFWTTAYDDVLRRAAYEQVTFISVNARVESFSCCEARNCRCAASGSPSCTLLTAARQEGSCSGGFSCCHITCTAGGPRASSSCFCTQYLNLQCRSTCGSCSAIPVEVSFAFHGVAHVARRVEYCGLSDTACVDSWMMQVRQTQRGWVDRNNADVFAFDLPLNVPAVVSSAVFGALALMSGLGGGLRALQRGYLAVCCPPQH